MPKDKVYLLWVQVGLSQVLLAVCKTEEEAIALEQKKTSTNPQYLYYIETWSYYPDYFREDD